jgi:hypothetical protein
VLVTVGPKFDSVFYNPTFLLVDMARTQQTGRLGSGGRRLIAKEHALAAKQQKRREAVIMNSVNTQREWTEKAKAARVAKQAARVAEQAARVAKQAARDAEQAAHVAEQAAGDAEQKAKAAADKKRLAVIRECMHWDPLTREELELVDGAKRLAEAKKVAEATELAEAK